MPLTFTKFREVKVTEPHAISDFLVRALRGAEPRTLKGSQLSVLVKTAFPDFTPAAFNCRTLREFIGKNAPEIVEFSKAGLDVSYCLRETREKLKAESSSLESASQTTALLLSNTRVWKTFVTPYSPFRIFFVPEQATIRVLPPNAHPLPNWREVHKISAEMLLQIGRDFTADREDVQREILAPLLDQPKWWIPFFDRLQALGLKSRWIEFRRRRVIEEFQRQMSEIASGTSVAQPSAPRVTEPAQLQPPADNPAATHAELSIRRIAADVVQRMTESELRALNLPLGYVIDSLTTR